ncbi:arginine--tRNA ligase [Castellaniella sp.]|uniref:arginine--tRNA ligase n=1 Tax=Castellaniella sp. TaxID=1955812 RepID=UPI00355D881A
MLDQQHAQLIALFHQALATVLPGVDADIALERPKVAAHGDVACNVAMQLARLAQRKPRELAQGIVSALVALDGARALIAHAEVAGPGFINLRLSAAAHQAVLAEIATQGTSFGHRQPQPVRMLIEFVSANPTGPLHVGHARQAALGDSLCRLFATQGVQVTREFYYNDAGNQIHNLAVSVQARARGLQPEDPGYPADGYRGEYIADIARAYLAQGTAQASDGTPVQASGDADDLEAIRRFAVASLRHEQDLDLQAFGLQFDHYYLESSLYADGRVEQTVQALIDAGHTYEHEGALWLRTTELGTGDDKDRVMRKSDGSYTYFVPDVAYHVTKWERGYRRAINIQGSDHHGTVARVRAGLQGLGLGIPADYPAYVLHKMVRVMRDGAEVKISKRAGSYVTLRDLIDWVGRDAVRFFLAMRRADAEFVFDIDLALSHSEENPVYYIQYAHARIHSLLRQNAAASRQQADLSRLVSTTEITLLKRLAEYPGVLTQAANELAPHQLAFWLRDCAADFHAWYNAERILVDEAPLAAARLELARSTAQVIANGLGLLGVSAPEHM